MPNVTLDYASPDSRSPRWLSNGAWAALAAGLTLLIIAMMSRAFAVNVAIGIFIDGVAAVAWCAAGAGLSATLLAWMKPVGGPALLRWITHIAIGLGVMGLVFLLLGLAGLLDRWTVLALLGAGILLLFIRLRSGVPAVNTWLNERSAGAAVMLAFAVPLALGLLCVSIAPGFLWKPLDPHPYDAMSYHLQVPREWFDAGQILPLTHNAFSFFPMAMETHYLAAMHLWGGPWAGMYLCQMLTLTHGILAVLAVIGVAEALGAPRRFAVMGGLLMACIPWTLMLSTVAYVESGVMLYTILAFGWAARALAPSPHRGDGRGEEEVRDHDPAVIDRSAAEQLPPHPNPLSHGERGPLLLAFLAAGLACGFKYTSFAMVAAPLVLLWPIVALASRRLSAAQAFRRLLPAVGCLLLVVSPLLVRNIAWAGNPVFPLAMQVFGQAHFTDEQVMRYQRAHQPPPAEASAPQRLAKGFERTVTDPQFGYLLIPLSLAASLLLIRRPEGGLLVGLLVLGVLVWLFATHVMPRFIAPMIPVMAVLVALAFGHAASCWAASIGRSAAAVVALQAVLGLGWTAWFLYAPNPVLPMKLSTLEMAGQGLYRLPDMQPLEQSFVMDTRLRGQGLALIGDAQAFFYVMPSDKLLYRTVFDVPTRNADDWLSLSIDELNQRGYSPYIQGEELKRLARSYGMESRHLDADR